MSGAHLALAPLDAEESDLDRRTAQLARLQAELAEQELELATLTAELQAFELVYLRRIGLRYAELDGVEAEVAELLATRSPADRAAFERAARARSRAAESERAAEWAAGDEEEGEEVFEPSEELKKLYRRVAKRVHPDLAEDADDQERRRHFMAEANHAYAQGDESRLQEILEEWEESSEIVKRSDPELQLARVLRTIDQVSCRLRAIAAALAKLRGSDLHRLHVKVERARRTGVDLLDEMARGLDRQIAGARRRLRALKEGLDPWVDELFASAVAEPAKAPETQGG